MSLVLRQEVEGSQGEIADQVAVVNGDHPGGHLGPLPLGFPPCGRRVWLLIFAQR